MPTPASGITEEAWNAITDHYPRIGSWIDDSTWLECDCGWDQQKSKTLGWWDHIEEALASAIGSESPKIPSSTHESHNTAGIGTGVDERA